MKNFIYSLFFLLSIRMITFLNIGSFNLKIIDIITIVLACITLILMLYKCKHNNIKIRFSLLDIIIIIYIIYSCVNILYANNKILAMADFYRLIVSCLAYFVITVAFKLSKNYKITFINACKYYIVGALLSIIYSTYIFYREGIPLIITRGALAFNSFSVRFSGLESDPNIYCIYLIIALAMLVKIYEMKQIKTYKFLISMIIICIAIIFTFSRSGLLMLIIYLFFFTDSKLKLKIKITVLSTIIITLLLIINPYNLRDILITRWTNTVSINTEQDYAIYTRTLYYKSAFLEFMSSPLLGVGRGNFAESAKQYFILPDDANPQGTFYQIASELGGIGLLIFITLIIYTIIKLSRLIYRYKKLSNNQKLLELSFAIIILYIISSFFGNFDSTREFWYILAIANSSIYYFKNYKEANNEGV